MATIPYLAPSAPSLALCARLVLSMPLSPSSLPLSAPAVLPSLPSFVSYLLQPARALFPRPCRPSLHDPTHAHSTLHLSGRAALWQHAAAPRLAQCPCTLRAARSVVGHHVTPFFAPPSRSLCPPASACTVRSNSARQRSLSAPLSAPAPWPCVAPCLLVLSRLALPLVPGCSVSGLLPLCPPPSVLSLVNQFSTIYAAGGPPVGAAGARPLCVTLTATGAGGPVDGATGVCPLCATGRAIAREAPRMAPEVPVPPCRFLPLALGLTDVT